MFTYRHPRHLAACSSAAEDICTAQPGNSACGGDAQRGPEPSPTAEAVLVLGVEDGLFPEQGSILSRGWHRRVPFFVDQPRAAAPRPPVGADNGFHDGGFREVVLW